MHEKGLKRQTGVGTLVNSQQRRALAALVVNCRTKGLYVPPLFYIGFPLFVLAKRCPGPFSQCAGAPEMLLASKATEMSAPCFAQRRPAPPSALPCADPPRSLCVRFWDLTGELFKWSTVFILCKHELMLMLVDGFFKNIGNLICCAT